MATWKEKGVVPDSDDEDALDSQSITNDDEAPNGERNDDIGSAENVIEANNIDGDEEGELNLKQNRLEHSNAAAPAVLDGDSKNFIDAPVPTFEPEISSKHVDGHDRVPASSPNSPKIFKVPKVFWELEEEPEEEPAVEKEPRSISRQGTGKPADDEISRSYVQITSPTSSLLSSLPANEVSLPLNAPVHRRESTPHQIEGREAFLSANPVRENVQGAATIAYMGRSLRQRNPIQLHPYIVEQEKYRQTLKARGIAPMRIAPSQHESHLGSRQTTSPELDSQEKDSQDATETGDSQPMDFDWDPLPSSPLEASENNLGTDVEVHKFTKGDKEGEDDDDDDDEEFPDIDELLSTRLPLPHPINPRRRLKSYSTKSKIQVLSRLQNERKGNPVRKVTSTGVTNVPASPPATSSPFPAASRESTVSSSHTKSRSPDESSRTLSAPNNLNRQKLANLPTPATSATKPIPVSVDSESGDELSSSDESIQIRKVSKKIRGVLPASHLRLDYQQKKPQPTSRTLRDSFSISPIKTEARRGVALPRTGAVQSPSASAGPRFDFLSSDSDDDEETGEGGFIFEDNLSSPLDSLFSQSRLGLAEEDDRIDAMLPSRKRQPASSKTRQRKRGRFRSSTLLPATDKPYTRQPKITEHLNRPQQSKARIKSSKQPRKLTSAPREQNQNHTNVPRQPAPPRLSILDVVDIPRKSGRGLPQFIKIAARTARSKLGQGKQSPSRKFIRLANREDTHDAQLVLEDWKAGRILPNSSQSLYPPSSRVSGHPLREIENNRQSKLQPPIPKLKSDPQTSNIGSVGIRRKLIISRGKQQSMNAFISREQRTFQNPNFPARDRAPKEGGWRRERPRHVPPAARFAQLESSEIEQSPKCSANAFRSTKKTLDALYRITRKRPVQQANLQLCRFLGDGDVVRPSIEPKDTVDDVEPKVGMTSASTNVNVHNKSRRKKRSPRRVDAGAAMYRQPSDPLILDFLVPASGPDTGVSEGRKLVGLAKFGTHYPLNFDIFPLRSGIFFHESTFIGSGRLSESIRRTGETHPRIIHSHTSLMLAGKTFSWGQWNEDVSSELGLSFDWLVDQLISQHSPLSSPPTIDAVGVISFVLEYVHHHLSFGGFDDVKNFLYRMTEILQDVSSRLNTAGENSKYQTESRAWIGVTSMSALLLLELLRIARARNEESLAYQLEDLMKKFATQCVKALVSQGLDCVRKLYDDLQYLSFREGGITSDEYVVQGWVIVMKVLEAAHIPRGSFWDVANSQIGGTDMKTISDARMMEKLWYTMFSLLPLCEFDEFGVIVEGRRQGAFFDNWSLPQQMLKRVFALYHANQRQSPGFNDYCRAIVSRCHYLMVEWGWWNCSIVVGTLFDFFGAHNLAHLRNEEAYASPHFLQELNKEPHLGLEPEDRCFHVFLKIVALAIKHFQQGGEGKSIRNLVARLMPNHNRQYPKEESIHQRDLASLRNHHDLLCTLYWAAAPQYRPSPTLIQELVLVDHSHKEACLINLRAWEQLASFVLAHDDERDAYELLKLWYQDFFSKLVQQYLKVEGEIRDQAHALQGTNGQILQEKQLQEIIMANKQTIMTSVCTSVKAIGRLIDEAQHPSGWINAYQTLNHVEVSSLLTVNLLTPDRHSKDSCALLSAYTEVLALYMDQIDARALLTQDEGDESKTTDEPVMLLEEGLATPFLTLINYYLRIPLPVSNIHGVDKLYKSLITCWARYIALVTGKREEVSGGNHLVFDGYVLDGLNGVFSNRYTNCVQAYYWPYFLVKLLEHKKSVDLENRFLPVFDFGKEWLLTLTKPEPGPFEEDFTAQLQKKGFRLSAGIPRHWAPAQKLRGAIRNMGQHMQQLAETMTYTSTVSKQLYSSLLVEVMKDMQTHLEAMDPPFGPKYETYLKIVHQVAADIKCHGADICQLSHFFLVPSRYYRPRNADPEFYTQGILNYCRMLSRHRERASYELFYYLLGGWKKAFVSGEEKMRKHIKHLNRAMKHSNFMSFLLAEFVPAILQTGFRNFRTRASMIHLAYLPSLAHRIGELLNGEEAKATHFFRQVINLLRIIMNCLLARFEYTIVPMFWDPLGEERSVRTMVCYFWLEVTPYLMNHAQRVRDKTPEDEQLLQELDQPFLHYLKRMDERLDPPYECAKDWMIPLWPVEDGRYCADFEKALEDDISDVVIESGRARVKVGRDFHWVKLSTYDESIPTFNEALQFGRIGRHTTIPSVENKEIMNLMF